ncbi:MAG: hypothetical protein HY812_13810 [Planctomycetes bacterium]|nr:hypothetical protein [Planctomycetota bacterium]
MLRTSLVLLAASVLALAAAPAASADDPPPDLLALAIQGPGTALVGTVVVVNVMVVNLGGPFSGDYSLDVFLSLDETIGPEDTVVATFSTSLIGSLTVSTNIPPDLPPDIYRWAVRIAPVPGEEVIFNNEILGGMTEVYQVDLEFDGPAELSAACELEGAAPAPQTVYVRNTGSANGILVFTVTEYPAASWLAVTPSASFALGGGDPQPVVISFNADGLAVGEYASSLIFLNYADPLDHAIIPVTLVVGEATIDAGDLIVGEIESANDSDEALFAGVEGMRLNLGVSSYTGNVRPVVSVLTADLQLIKSWTIPHSAKQVKKSVKLPASGMFRLRIEGDGDSLGAYVVGTKRKLPAAAKPFHGKVKPDKATGLAQVTLLGLPVGEFGFCVEPTKGFSGTINLTLVRPGGQALDISSMAVPLANGGIEATGVTLEDLGAYTLVISGFGGNKEKVEVEVTPKQAPPGAATVLLP